MDGVRIVSRLKKKLTDDVNKYCFGPDSKPCPDDSACNVQSPACQMGPSSSQVEDGLPGSDGFN